MDREFLFMFGYESPSERESNRLQGTDYESTGFVRILARDEEQAQAWGEEVAERFVSWLHGDPTLSWKREQFAAWLETAPDAATAQRMDEIPMVRVGEFPLRWAGIAAG